MKKKVLTLLFTIAVIMSTTACSGKDAVDTNTDNVQNEIEETDADDATQLDQKPETDDSATNEIEQDDTNNQDDADADTEVVVEPEIIDDPDSFVIATEGNGFVAYEPKNNLDDQMELVDGITLANILKVMDKASDNGVYNDSLLRQMACVALKDKETLSNMTVEDLADALAPWATLGFYFEENMEDIVVLSVKVDDHFALTVTVDGVEDIWYVNGRTFLLDHGEKDISNEFYYFDEVWQYIVDTNIIVDYFHL